MIKFQNVSKHYGTQDILVDASFMINDGERVGFVGPNGAGKSTLFAMIVRETAPDKGQVEISKGWQVGLMRQQLNPHLVEGALFDYVLDGVAHFKEIEERISSIEASFGELSGDTRESALKALGELQTRFEHLGGYDLRHRAESALCGLGFEPASLAQPFQSFSGGWQLRAELARVLVAAPHVILLDEPTNYLDTPAIEWLQKYLRDFRGTLLLISHDRYLLNTLTDVTVEIGNGNAVRYGGNYAYYVTERERRYEQLVAAKRNQDRVRQQAERFVERFRSTSTKASQAQSKQKMLDRMEDIRLPPALRSPGRIRLPKPPHCGREVIRLDNAGASYDGKTWVWRHVDLRIEKGDKFAFIGLNGTGKSTLMRVLTGHMELTEGRCHLGHKVQVGYQSQDFAETLPPDRTAQETVKAASGGRSDQDVRTLLGSFGFTGDSVEKRVEVLSGGEKVRVAFARLLANPPNLLILDEPTTHLDISARETLEDALRHYEGTLCLVSHDIEFVRHVAENVVAMTPPGITRYWGGYDYYREKVAAGEAPSEHPAAGSGDSDKRIRRRERAEKRQSLSKQRRPLLARIRKAEKRLAVLEKEQEVLLEKLNPVHGNSDYATINRRLAEIHVDETAVTAEWEEASLALEAMDAE